ncbi:hypothetical protein K469DRAFT_754059 [Zopfia rhizophila CBS 207.26]|uniref:C2H2-type domain-containing protein n=1 Tax=Zopfia rhizophila CBS 207.26 TaxID=1314779 RepID=A0A6A6DMJ2_9PEZI|nr:hypothetical protein K469DRAFT_754059 [Zopfia rhizophila CBS 207.26]
MAAAGSAQGPPTYISSIPSLSSDPSLDLRPYETWIVDDLAVGKRVTEALQITKQIIGLCKSHIANTNDGGSYVRIIFTITSSIKAVFKNLQFLIDSGMSTIIHSLATLNRPIAAYLRSASSLERLFHAFSDCDEEKAKEISTRNPGKFKLMPLAWSFKEHNHARRLLGEMAHCKMIINGALTADSLNTTSAGYSSHNLMNIRPTTESPIPMSSSDFSTCSTHRSTKAVGRVQRRGEEQKFQDNGERYLRNEIKWLKENNDQKDAKIRELEAAVLERQQLDLRSNGSSSIDKSPKLSQEASPRFTGHDCTGILDREEARFGQRNMILPTSITMERLKYIITRGSPKANLALNDQLSSLKSGESSSSNSAQPSPTSNTSGTSGISSETTNTQNASNKRKRSGQQSMGNDNEESGDEDDNRRRKRKGKAASKGSEIERRRLKCPYYQKSPEEYTRAACSGQGFADMAKLKDHLKRVHTRPLKCMRCWDEMTSIQERDRHLQTDPICKNRSEPPDDRICAQRLQELNFNGGPFTGARNVEEKWKILFRILFPAEANVPSPFYQSCISALFKRVFGHRLDQELLEQFGPSLAPAIANIQTKLPTILCECEEEVARIVRERDQSASTPDNDFHEYNKWGARIDTVTEEVCPAEDIPDLDWEHITLPTGIEIDFDSFLQDL